MGTHFTPESKIKGAPTKIAVSVWMPQTTMVKGDILWLHRRDMRTGLWTHFEDTSMSVPMGEADWRRGNKRLVRDDNSGPQQSWVQR
jgi:hypothetical protein